jgi:hypothetical protein
MAEQELEITISPEGKVTVRTHGIKGAACMEYADMLVQIVGREEEREKTAEFYQVEQETAQIRIQQRR